MGVSGVELLVIAVLALIVIGPKDLPAAFRTLGRVTAQWRRMALELQRQFDEMGRDVERSAETRSHPKPAQRPAKPPASADGASQTRDDET